MPRRLDSLDELPLPDVRELDGREAYEALVEHFGWTDTPTVPMALEELPGQLALEPMERDLWAQVLAPLRRGLR
jgi:hypothetical protein